ncbi:phage holin family protein [Paenibacillus sp. N4]|uniref:phage holin family protein n=1 Tax=Paenibacillus vietnamensis TaxID=2590547 RepID=UPI001CD12922|nr:phage holin family protein [Paenibacillus vietnamensis]MCA0754894.1 phage holin family protein [Paenibacillus vietnamensis]
MDWNAIFQMIDPKLLIVVAVCWVLGFLFKQTPRVPNWSIVYIVTAVALGLTVWLIGWGPEAVIQGILAGAFAVFGHQLVKQVSERAGTDD